MAGHTSSRKRADGIAPRYYTCSLTNGGCGMSVLAEPVEDLVKARVLADVNDPELAAELSAEASALGDVRAAAQAEVERLDVMLADLEVKRVAGQVRPHAYEAAKGHLDKLVAAAETTLREVGAPAPAGMLPAVSGAEWDAMTAAEKRTLIAGCTWKWRCRRNCRVLRGTGSTRAGCRFARKFGLVLPASETVLLRLREAAPSYTYVTPSRPFRTRKGCDERLK